MVRSERLLSLLQILRLHRFPVTGTALARELGISVRTLYRDIATLQSQGADIAGEPGMGYVLRPGFTLPPLMFSIEEIEALVLGMRWVGKRTDTDLAEAARHALAKISAVLPADLRHELDSTALLIGPSNQTVLDGAMLAELRSAIRGERKLRLDYCDAKGVQTERVIWPFAIGFFDDVHVLVAWCENRQGFRHFRLDRMNRLAVLDARYPHRRQVLLSEWRKQEGIAAR